MPAGSRRHRLLRPTRELPLPSAGLLATPLWQLGAARCGRPVPALSRPSHDLPQAARSCGALLRGTFARKFRTYPLSPKHASSSTLGAPSGRRADSCCHRRAGCGRAGHGGAPRPQRCPWARGGASGCGGQPGGRRLVGHDQPWGPAARLCVSTRAVVRLCGLQRLRVVPATRPLHRSGERSLSRWRPDAAAAIGGGAHRDPEHRCRHPPSRRPYRRCDQHRAAR